MPPSLRLIVLLALSAFPPVGGQSRGGRMYSVPTDTPTAIKWLTRAADIRMAVKWFEAAATGGSAEAQYEMGKHCAAVSGTERDDKLATEYYLQAAEQGMAKAQHDMAVRHDIGKGVPVDKKASARWYLAAAKKNHVESGYNYGPMDVGRSMTAAEKRRAHADDDTGLVGARGCFERGTILARRGAMGCSISLPCIPP